MLEVSCTEDGVRVEIGWVYAVPEEPDLGAERGRFGAQFMCECLLACMHESDDVARLR